jgi:hypothetical protein
MTDRIDELLAEVLATGVIPAGASEVERAELETLVGSAQSLRSQAVRLEAEASRTMPTARARFQRHVAAQAAMGRPAPRIATAPRLGLFGALGLGRTMTLAASAAAIGIIALVAVFTTQSFGGVEAASALTKDDYVQVSGVVSSVEEQGGERTVNVQSPEFGNLEVALSDLTSIMNDQAAVDPSTIKAGESLLIGGVVVRDDKTPRIAAKTLAVSEKRPGATPPRVTLKVLRELGGGLEGMVTVFAVSPDGQDARVVIDAGKGRTFVVKVDPASVAALLNPTGTVVGARVRVAAATGGPADVFSLVRLAAPPPAGRPGVIGPGKRPDAGQSPNTPSFVRIAGTVTGRVGAVLQVSTDAGPVQVVLQPHTRIFPGDSGLTLRGFLAGETATGYPVLVVGGVEAATSRIAADAIIFAAKSQQ